MLHLVQVQQKGSCERLPSAITSGMHNFIYIWIAVVHTFLFLYFSKWDTFNKWKEINRRTFAKKHLQKTHTNQAEQLDLYHFRISAIYTKFLFYLQHALMKLYAPICINLPLQEAAALFMIKVIGVFLWHIVGKFCSTE